MWSDGDYSALDQLVAPIYTIHSDPGDAWEGQSLDRATYTERVRLSRQVFPDLNFDIQDMVVGDGRVAVRWIAQGTQHGDLPGVPATRRRLSFAGQTIYELKGGLVAGHWQVIDRLGFVQQLR
jgi:steroid delta-isomerase-like uncharacterized protein